MLIICNGTFKSGSSWLHAIISDILELKNVPLTKIPISYNPNITSPTRILEKNLDLFVKKEDCFNCNYLTKAHFFNKKTLSRTYDNEVRFIFVNRDIKDAIVSHYFHFINYRKSKWSFDRYFNLIGVYKAYEMFLFNYRCEKYFNASLFLSYEDLKLDFSNSIKKVCEILSLDELNDSEILEIKNTTSLKAMRTKAKKDGAEYYPELGGESYKLFRKGEIGDWKNHISLKNRKKIDAIINGDISLITRIIYYLLFTLRRRLNIL